MYLFQVPCGHQDRSRAMPCWASLWASLNFKDLLNIKRVVCSSSQEPSAANTGAVKPPRKLECCVTLSGVPHWWRPRPLDLKGVIMFWVQGIVLLSTCKYRKVILVAMTAQTTCQQLVSEITAKGTVAWSLHLEWESLVLSVGNRLGKITHNRVW